MIINITAEPTNWNGSPLGVGPDKCPRDLKSFVLQALAEAQIVRTNPAGQRETEPPSALLKRFRTSAKIEAAQDSVELETEEFQLVEHCIAALFKEAVSVRLMGCLHQSVGSLASVKAADG